MVVRGAEEGKHLRANETAKVHDHSALINKRAQTKRSDCMLLLTGKNKRGEILRFTGKDFILLVKTHLLI